MRFKIIPGLLVLLIACEFTAAQQTPSKIDSARFYNGIEAYSKQSKFTKFIYRLIFNPVVPKSSNSTISKNVGHQPYKTFEGKIIRRINIETLDPFGYSLIDTSVKPQNFFLKAGNKVHKKTMSITVRNLLLIHPNHPFDSLLVMESERLVRSRDFVRDIDFHVNSVPATSDSVDIYIKVRDNWSIIPNADVSTSSQSLQLTDRNFLGLGHVAQLGYSAYPNKHIYDYNADYAIANIRNTYINTTLHIGTDEAKNFTRSLSIDRPFFSPFAKWAGGLLLDHQTRTDSLKDLSLKHIPVNVVFNTQDYWIGKAQQLLKGNTEDERVTNLIFSLRLLHIKFLKKPPEQIDLLHMYANEYFYLAGIGLSTRKYVQDRFIFNYGIVEDVPIGKVYGLTGGYQIRDGTRRLYLGARLSVGNYIPWGYLSSNIEYGTFLRASRPEQGVLSAEVDYFTGLLEIGKWRFRQFIKPQIFVGLHRFAYDSLTLNDHTGLIGFNSSELSGTSRLVCRFQSQSYAPWSILGFHFGFYVNYSFGMLGNDTKGFKNSRVYSQFGLGVLIKNMNLVANIFQISISFYPYIPGVGRNIAKFDNIKTTDFGFRDFEIGKPDILQFK